MSSVEQTAAEHPWGRVAADGTVYVRTADGERIIGQWPGGDPEEAMALYVRRFEGLELEVDLLQRRLESGTLGPDDASKAVTAVREQIDGAAALGDLDGLLRRLDALNPAIERRREERRAERAEQAEQSKTQKARIVAEAERLADGQDWRSGADRFRTLLEEWKGLPRIDRRTDEEMWHRFSSARTTFTRRRKAHFAEQQTQRDTAARAKEKLIAEAEALSGSTDWGPTSGAYRDLMQRWKAAGPAPRKQEDALWKRFRAAQDVFFSARDEANAAQDREYEANAEIKDALLAEAEALLPVTDVATARRAWHGIAERWEAAGKVPRARVKEMEGRIRAVEQAIRSAEDSQWRRTDPEKSARADDMVGKLESAIEQLRAELTAAEAEGDQPKATELRENLASREQFLDMARRAAEDYS